jgi:hypothetical protein
VFSIEDRIWNGQGNVCNSHRPSDAWCKPGGAFVGEVIAAPPERHFWVRNAPYQLTNLCNSLISQQMRPPSERTKGNKLLMRKIFSRFLLPHCYSQRALVLVPRNLPCLISRALVKCLLLWSSHLYLNQRPAKTTISTREGSGVAQRRNRRASLSTRAASCRCRPSCVRFEIS